MFLRKLILSNLSVHRARFALTVAAVALSVSLVVSVTTGFTSMVAVAEKYLGEHMGTSDLAVTRSKGDPHGTFPQSVADDLGRDPRVKSVLVRYESGSLLLDAKGQKLPGRPVELIGIRRPGDQSVEALKMESDKSGAWFNGSREEHDVAVIDQILARRLKVGVGGTITLAGEKPLKLKVVGVIHKPAIMAADQQTVYMPLETMQDFFAKRGQINRVMITLKSSTEADIYKERWLPKIQKTDPLLAMKSAGDMRKQMYENLSGLSLLSYMGATVSMLAATFIVFSALSMGVGERQRVLAMLRAIGAHRAQIGWLVVIEGLMIALAGAGLGAPLGWLWVKILAVWKHEIFSEGVVIDWAGVLFGVVGSMVTALAASFLPAHTASRVDPLEAMSPLAKPPGSRLPFRATLIGLGLIAIDPLY